MTLPDALLILTIKDLPVHEYDTLEVDVGGKMEKIEFVERDKVLVVVEHYFKTRAARDRGLDVVASRGGTISFGPAFVKIKFPNCPAFLSDTLADALEIAERIGEVQGGTT